MDDGGAPITGANENARFTRRTVLKGALAAQTAVWAAPVITVLRPDPALAGSAPPTTGVDPGGESRRPVGDPASRGVDRPGASGAGRPGTGQAAAGERTEVLAFTGGPSPLLTGLGLGAVGTGAAAVAYERRGRAAQRGGDDREFRTRPDGPEGQMLDGDRPSAHRDD